MTQALHIGDQESFRYRNLEIDWREMRVAVDAVDVHLSPIEFRLLSLLVRRRGWVVQYEQILRDVWGSSYIADRANHLVPPPQNRTRSEPAGADPDEAGDRLHLRAALAGGVISRRLAQSPWLQLLQ
jgi:hypothetical protein